MYLPVADLLHSRRQPISREEEQEHRLLHVVMLDNDFKISAFAYEKSLRIVLDFDGADVDVPLAKTPEDALEGQDSVAANNSGHEPKRSYDHLRS